MQDNNIKVKSVKISTKNSTDKILSCLPSKFREAYMVLEDAEKNSLSEIRIRAGRPASFTCGDRNVPLWHISIAQEELEEICGNFCCGSLYSYGETIRHGYIPFNNSRIGIAGEAFCDANGIKSFKNITSLNIRIPRDIAGAADAAIAYIENKRIENTLGIVAISPANCGKTTFLKALAKGISNSYRKEPLRVCIADEREEIYTESFFKDCLCDVISSCPKAEAFEIARRTLSSQVVICDEIGNENEANQLSRAYSRGIYTVASFHGRSLEDLLSKKYMRRLIDEGVFKTAYVLERRGNEIVGKICSIGTLEEK